MNDNNNNVMKITFSPFFSVVMIRKLPVRKLIRTRNEMLQGSWKKKCPLQLDKSVESNLRTVKCPPKDQKRV